MLEGKPKLPPLQAATAMDLNAAGMRAEPAAQAKIPIVPLIVGLVLVVIIAIGLAMRGHKTNTVPTQAETTQQAPPAEPESKTACFRRSRIRKHHCNDSRNSQGPSRESRCAERSSLGQRHHPGQGHSCRARQC